MIIRGAEIGGRVTNLLITDGRIADIGDTLKDQDYFDAYGVALIPGLHDHHIHLNATAAAMTSLRCGPPEVQTESELIKLLNQENAGWIRGVAYHHSVAGKIDRFWLDKYGPNRAVRIQHRSGRLWILNSLAMAELDITSPEDGRLFDSDKMLRRKTQFPDLRPLIKRLLSYGITGVTEVTPSNGKVEYENYKKRAMPLRLSIMGHAELPSAQFSHLKLHYHDHDLPALEALTDEIERAHKSGRNIAAHCVTRAELMLTLAALDMAGAIYGDRIEHAAIADDAAIEWMQKLGVIVVTQPNFIMEREKAYLKDVPKKDHQNLWRLKAFEQAGLRLAAGSDAPFGDPNPWAAMAAATARPKGFETEAITPEMALEIYTKPAKDAGGAPRKIAIGESADMCLLDRPWKKARENLGDVKVKASWIDGKLVYNGVD